MTRILAMRCRDEGMARRFTKIHHPWTNGELERMKRTVKDAILKRFHYDSFDPLRRHLDEFVAACNFGRRLKCLRGLAPYEFICMVHLQGCKARADKANRLCPGGAPAA